MHIPTTLGELPTSKPRFVGQAIAPLENRAHITGRTEYIDNVSLPGMLHCAILRSPQAHARLRKVDASAAIRMPGVAAVVTGEDALRWTHPAPGISAGCGTHCIATEKVRFVGEPVAAVAAVSRYVAEDAIERIEVTYEPLPPVVDAVAALDAQAPLVFDAHGTNVMFHRVYTWGEVDESFARADRVFTEKFRWHRMGANAMETFGVIAEWHPEDGSVTCRGGFQMPGMLAAARAAVLGLPPSKVRLISHPRGGSFGSKAGILAGTDISVLLSRKAGGRPVKWIEDRMEALVAGSNQAWDRSYEASIAVKNDGTLLGFKVTLVEDLGATGQAPFAFFSAVKPLASFTGCYTIRAAAYDLTAVATNKVPAAFYRGAGPPPHNFVLEQMVDIAARGIGIDAAAIRRRNFIPPDRFPYTIPSGNEYDSGNYEATLDTALGMADYQALRRQQAAAYTKGRYLGIGVVSVIEPGVGESNVYAEVGVPTIGAAEGVTVSIDALGYVMVRVGFTPEGQAQHTLARQVAADYFSVDMDTVRVVALDSQAAPPNVGPAGSRCGVAMTGAILGACACLTEKLARMAASLLQVHADDLELMDGMLRLKRAPETKIPVTQVVATMLGRSDLLPPGVDPSVAATYAWTSPGRSPIDAQGRCKSYLTAANACHVGFVEVDPHTGVVKVLNYWGADDCGTRLNPGTVEGMIDGGIAQGVGAALLEEYVYSDAGQPLTATLSDYLQPTIHEVPANKRTPLVTPSPFAPLGAKGTGEGALHTAPAAILCAVNDALVLLGARATEVPATPERVWRLIRTARPARGGGP